MEGNSVQLNGPPDDCAVRGMQPVPWAHLLELQKQARRAQAAAERPGLVTRQKQSTPHRPQRPLLGAPGRLGLSSESPERAAARCSSLRLTAACRQARGQRSGQAAFLVVKGRAEGRELCICAALTTASTSCLVLLP